MSLDPGVNPTQQLWCAVLLEAVQDALHGTDAHTSEEARAYILRPHPDFLDVCTLAGFDPDAVREGVRQHIDGTARKQPKQPKPTYQPLTITHDGKTLTVKAWSEITGIPPTTINGRLSKGWPIAEALTLPPGARANAKTYRHQGRMLTIAQLAQLSGLSVNVLKGRLQILHWSVERALSEPVKPAKGRRRTSSPKIQLDAAKEDRRASEGCREMEHPSPACTIPSHTGSEPALPCSPELAQQYAPLSLHVNLTKVDRGVVCDFRALLGTGGGPVAQEIAEIPFTLEPAQ